MPFIDLGMQPSGNIYPKSNDPAESPRYPMRMSVCTESWIAQIDEIPMPSEMFNNHPYITGINKPVVEHMESMVDHICRKLRLKPGMVALDIGANDGTLLSFFKKKGLVGYGVDPGSITGKIARLSGHNVLEVFWNEETAQICKTLKVDPDIITATAVFYHTPDLQTFVRGIKTLLNTNSVFVAQCVYLKDLIENVQFDHFYHEHTCIYSVQSILMLLERNGMRLFDIEFTPIHGGSFIAYCCLAESNYIQSDNVRNALEVEKNAGLHSIDIYRNFKSRVDANRNELVSILREIKSAGKNVYALGAPLKGSTLLNYFGIDHNLVEAAVEVNPEKIGKFIPGVGIPIISEESIQSPPDYYLLLVWNFRDYFIKKYSNFIDNGGSIIVPNPTVQIVKK